MARCGIGIRLPVIRVTAWTSGRYLVDAEEISGGVYTIEVHVLREAFVGVSSKKAMCRKVEVLAVAFSV